ncbi:MAG: hypothetical protein M3321_06685 [Actinomycetota bacterium]|nr:hypothetical protein [Actinomycetota bacterium]
MAFETRETVGYQGRVGMKAKFAVGAVVAPVIGVASVTAGAHGFAGGTNIANAPLIALNQNIQSYFGGRHNYGYQRNGDYFKVNFRAGDRVLIRAQSVGRTAPCILAFRPGTDDFNFRESNYIQGTYNRNTNHNQLSFIAGQTGTFVLVMHDGCDAGWDSGQWTYAFTVSAPHGLRLTLPSGYLVPGTNRVRVRVRDALNEPVTDRSLAVTLAVQWPRRQPRPVARVPVNAGVASFTFALPNSARGKRVRLVVRAGDGVTWVSSGASRTYAIR